MRHFASRRHVRVEIDIASVEDRSKGSNGLVSVLHAQPTVTAVARHGTLREVR
jgi:hypothetical protein